MLIGVLVSAALLLAVLVDAFEAMILPRRVLHRFRLARLFYRTTWLGWRVVASCLPRGRRRESLLGLLVHSRY